MNCVLGHSHDSDQRWGEVYGRWVSEISDLKRINLVVLGLWLVSRRVNFCDKGTLSFEMLSGSSHVMWALLQLHTLLPSCHHGMRCNERDPFPGLYHWGCSASILSLQSWDKSPSFVYKIRSVCIIAIKYGLIKMYHVGSISSITTLPNPLKQTLVSVFCIKTKQNKENQIHGFFVRVLFLTTAEPGW